MGYIEAKKRNGRAYFYLTQNRRVGGKWKKTRRYIGTSRPSLRQKVSPLASAYKAALPKIMALSKNKKVVACYLFGSYVKNPASAHDIDICIIGKGMSSDEMSRIALEFEKPIDLSFIERMPHYIAINVLREGKPFFIADKAAFSKKWLETVGSYLENQPMRERIYSGVERWMNLQTLQTG